MGLKNFEAKKARAQALIVKTVYEGKSNEQAAKEMNISTDTVARSLQWAGEAGIFVEYERRLLTELLPLAHESVKMALEDGDAQVGLKVMEMAQKKVDQSSEKMEKGEEGGLYDEIRKLRAGFVIDVTPRGELSSAESAGAESIVIPFSLSDGGVYGVEENTPNQGQNGTEVVETTIEGNE